MIVLDTSAGEGFVRRSFLGAISATETEHLGARNTDLRRGFFFEGLKWVFLVNGSAEKEAEKDMVLG